MTTKMWTLALVVGMVLGGGVEAQGRGGGRKIAPGGFSLASPANGAVNQSQTPTLSWTAASRASSYTITIGSLAPVSVSATSYAVPSGRLTAGTAYSWNVTAVNAYGSTPSLNGPFVFTTAAAVSDTTAPTVSVSCSPSVPDSTQAVTYTANASDASGIAEIRLFVDGVMKKQVFSATTCSYSEGPYAQGSAHSFYAVAFDNSTNRNSATSSTGSFTVSAPPPPPPTSVTTQGLAAVQFVDANFVIAVGNNGTVVRSFNGGSSWSASTVGTNAFYAVSYIDANIGNLVGGNTLFAIGKNYRTTNGSDALPSYTSQGGNGNVLGGVSFADASHGVVVGNGGYVAYTSTGGSWWDVGQANHPLAPYCTLYEVDMVDASTGTAVGSKGYIGRTTNGGATWTVQSSGTTSDLYGVSFTDSQNGYAVGTNGVVLRTTNGGGSWTAPSSGTTIYTFRSVSCTDANTATAVGDAGVIFRTTNGGSTWVPQASGTQYQLYGVSFRDANNGVAVGYGGLIYQTTNGGSTWVRRN